MASRRFFGYDPYDYYYAAPPSDYPFPYYQRRQQPSDARSVGGFFPAAAAAAEPVIVRPRPAATAQAVNPNPKTRTVSIPVHFVRSDTEPAAVPKKRAPSAEAAALQLQAAARGFLARRAVRSLRAVEREAEEIARKVTREAEALLRGDARARVAVGEALMRLLLRLDAVRGAREYRRRVARRVLALQDAVDALEPRPEPAAAAEEPGSEVTQAAPDEVAAGSDTAPELPDAQEQSDETEAKGPAEAVAEMEVDGDRVGGESCATDETEHAADGVNHGDDMSENADAEGEREMVTEEPAPAVEAEASAEPPRQLDGQVRKAEAACGANGGGLDAKKVMEMLATLCERSAQQCAVIGALAERVDALERAVRRVEDAERRRRRARKLKKAGKGSNQDNCYVD